MDTNTLTLSYRLLDVSGPLGGVLGMVVSPQGLQRMYLPARDARRAKSAILRDCPAAQENPGLLPALAAELTNYFGGRRVDFSFVALDFGHGTEFEQRIWQACFEIPYGITQTYGELAREAGRPGAARTVGTAMARNRIPIVVPCHRITAAGGKLGGYSGPGGVDTKRRLLDMEARVTALDREPKIYGFDKPYAWLATREATL